MSVLFTYRQLVAFVVRVDRNITEFTAAAIADGDLRHEPVHRRIDDCRDDEDHGAQVKMLPRRSEPEECDRRDDDEGESQFLREVFADEQVLASAGGTLGEQLA